MRLDERDFGEFAGHEFRRISRQKPALYSDPFQTRSELSKVVNHTLGGIEGRAGGLKGRGPELPMVFLVRLHSVSDIGRLVRTAFDIDQERQIAADANRVEMIEEEEAVAAQEILDVVLRANHHGVHAGLVEKIVKARAVEWRRGGLGRRRH